MMTESTLSDIEARLRIYSALKKANDKDDELEPITAEIINRIGERTRVMAGVRKLLKQDLKTCINMLEFPADYKDEVKSLQLVRNTANLIIKVL
ncbi:hypothetical protein [Candidatus Nitrososphaera evergladensis]|uniref:hypothetical protein n=1 Tax=Candidatus Nitrososphaera evergladensis TaxID=1459637 RepID=UPI0011E5E5C8|nr:hypothetical protein [Candidatus Nitrososphaera evergladensis]